MGHFKKNSADFVLICSAAPGRVTPRHRCREVGKSRFSSWLAISSL
jgi:hypothetical protein